MNKVILITGTSSGLGISLSVKLAKAGHTVYATMRDLAKQQNLLDAAKASAVSLSVLQLDVQDSHSVRECVEKVIEAEGKIDVLINNAGAGYVRTTEQANEDDVNWVMDVNFHGVVRCTKAVLPYMREARQGHVINITSVGGLVGQPFNEFYCAAKFAVEGYIESLASYVTAPFNIHFTNVEPGGIATEFANNVMEHVGSTGGILDDEYRPILEHYMSAGAGTPRDGLYQTPDEVADVVIDCLDCDEPPIRRRTSSWGEEFTRFKTKADPDGKAQNQLVIDQFLPTKT